MTRLVKNEAKYPVIKIKNNFQKSQSLPLQLQKTQMALMSKPSVLSRNKKYKHKHHTVPSKSLTKRFNKVFFTVKPINLQKPPIFEEILYS